MIQELQGQPAEDRQQPTSAVDRRRLHRSPALKWAGLSGRLSFFASLCKRQSFPTPVAYLKPCCSRTSSRSRQVKILPLAGGWGVEGEGLGRLCPEGREFFRTVVNTLLPKVCERELLLKT